MGNKKIHHEPFLILTEGDKQEYTIQSYNEYLYLVSKELENGTVIASDTNIYEVDQHYSKRNLAQIQEFTGLVTITVPPRTVQLIEFIRVTHK